MSENEGLKPSEKLMKYIIRERIDDKEYREIIREVEDLEDFIEEVVKLGNSVCKLHEQYINMISNVGQK